MRRFVLIPGLLLFFVQALFSSLHSSPESLFPICWSGTAALRRGQYETALEQVLADSSASDSLFRMLKLGSIHYGLKNHSKALFLFRFVAQKSPALAPFAYEYIADIEIELGRKDNGLSAYRAALEHPMPSKYKTLLFGKIRSAIDEDTSELARAPWLDEYYRWLASMRKPDSSLLVLTDTLVVQKAWGSIDSLLDTMQLSGDEACGIVRSLHRSGFAAELGAKTLFSLSLAAFSCREYKIAEKLLTIASKKRDFKEVSERRALYLQAQIAYNVGKFDDAVKLYKRYETRFGAEPEVILNIARAYRKIDKHDESAIWYERYIKAYPSSSMTQEIIWLRAWQQEEKKRFAAATEYYKKIYTTYRNGKRTDESYFRHALCHYRQEQYDSAITMLNVMLRKFPSSSHALAAQYWKGKCQLARDKVDSAREIFKQVSKSDPHDYYAHRARQVMLLLGDTCELAIDTIYRIAPTVSWLDSVSPGSKKNLTPKDSLDFYRGMCLVAIGKLGIADIFLEPLEMNFPGNLRLQYEMAMLYTIAEASAQGYRIARRLTWRVPQEARGGMPLALYSLLYPSYYADLIRSESSDRNVDPYFVSAVIRQESIFNPTIRSPVGAIGLMQIMPYTGKEIADKIGEQFVVDSLTCPVVNVRYGVFYIRELLNQFNDNLVLVLAGYNGGPHNALKWYNRNKDQEFDLFVEDIAFTETRVYVKKVLGNYWTYRHLARNPGFNYGRSVPITGIAPVMVPDDSAVAKRVIKP